MDVDEAIALDRDDTPYEIGENTEDVINAGIETGNKFSSLKTFHGAIGVIGLNTKRTYESVPASEYPDVK